MAGWLGIGTEQLRGDPHRRRLAMRLDLLEQQIETLYREDSKVAFVMATFGTTDGFGIDDIAAIRECIDKFAKQHQQPTPQLHVDAAVGWAMDS